MANETGGNAGAANGNGQDPAGGPYTGWRIALGALVVLVGLAAVVVSLSLILSHYDVGGGTPAPGGDQTDEASVSASSVVAVLTPVIAGIAAIVGLYFGISATGSARGRQAEAAHAQASAAQAQAEAQTKTAEAMPDLASAVTEALVTEPPKGAGRGRSRRQASRS